MIQCQSCHYTALGQVDLIGHLRSVHGFGYEAAREEARRVVGEISPPKCAQCATERARVMPLLDALQAHFNQHGAASDPELAEAFAQYCGGR